MGVVHPVTSMVTVLLPDEAVPAGERVESEHILELDPIPRLVAVARAFVAEHAPALDPDTHDTIVLLTSELVTNVVIHARTPLQVGIAVTPHAVIVSVHDLDIAPDEHESVPEREGGRGLMLVEALSDATGLHRYPGGKTVWFRIKRGPPPTATLKGVGEH